MAGIAESFLWVSHFSKHPDNSTTQDEAQHLRKHKSAEQLSPSAGPVSESRQLGSRALALPLCALFPVATSPNISMKTENQGSWTLDRVQPQVFTHSVVDRLISDSSVFLPSRPPSFPSFYFWVG